MLSTSLGCFQCCDLQKQLEKLMGGNHLPGGDPSCLGKPLLSAGSLCFSIAHKLRFIPFFGISAARGWVHRSCCPFGVRPGCDPAVFWQRFVFFWQHFGPRGPRHCGEMLREPLGMGARPPRSTAMSDHAKYIPERAPTPPGIPQRPPQSPPKPCCPSGPTLTPLCITSASR